MTHFPQTDRFPRNPAFGGDLGQPPCPGPVPVNESGATRRGGGKTAREASSVRQNERSGEARFAGGYGPARVPEPA